MNTTWPPPFLFVFFVCLFGWISVSSSFLVPWGRAAFPFSDISCSLQPHIVFSKKKKACFFVFQFRLQREERQLHCKFSAPFPLVLIQ